MMNRRRLICFGAFSPLLVSLDHAKKEEIVNMESLIEMYNLLSRFDSCISTVDEEEKELAKQNKEPVFELWSDHFSIKTYVARVELLLTSKASPCELALVMMELDQVLMFSSNLEKTIQRINACEWPKVDPEGWPVSAAIGKLNRWISWKSISMGRCSLLNFGIIFASKRWLDEPVERDERALRHFMEIRKKKLLPVYGTLKSDDLFKALAVILRVYGLDVNKIQNFKEYLKLDADLISFDK